jgi:hypothetical protein
MSPGMLDRRAPEPALARRQAPRFPVKGRLKTRIATLHLDVDMRDVSAGGFLVASPIDITTGDLHVFEVTIETGERRTLRARAVHCHAPRAGEPAYLSGWRCATDEATQVGLEAILAHLIEHDTTTDEPAMTPPQRTATAWQIAIAAIASGNVAGHAVICTDLRYASLRWLVAAQIDRRYGSPAMWRAVTAELEQAGETGLLPPDSVTASLLLPEALRGSCALRVEDRPAFPAHRRDALTDELDRHLWQLADAVTT